MTKGDRIRMIRELADMNQRDFASSIKISQPALAMFENGQREPKDIHIDQICEKIKINGEMINKDWLYTGRGNPTIKMNRNQEIFDFTNNVMELPDQDIKKKILLAIAKLTDEDWKRLTEIANQLFLEQEKERQSKEDG